MARLQELFGYRLKRSWVKILNDLAHVQDSLKEEHDKNIRAFYVGQIEAYQKALRHLKVPGIVIDKYHEETEAPK